MIWMKLWVMGGWVGVLCNYGVSLLVKTKSLTITNFYPDVHAMKYFCNTKIFKTLEYDQSLKSGQKEGVLIFQLQLVIDKKFFHHSSPANNPANSYYVNKKLFTSKITDLQIRSPVCQMCIGGTTALVGIEIKYLL